MHTSQALPILCVSCEQSAPFIQGLAFMYKTAYYKTVVLPHMESLIEYIRFVMCREKSTALTTLLKCEISYDLLKQYIFKNKIDKFP